jgi:hypothetical protein
LSFLKKNIHHFPNFSFINGFNPETEIPSEMKNKRIWQLTPLEIWELFNLLK